MKKIVIIVGHPNTNSLCNSLAKSYADHAKRSGADVSMLRLGEMKFDPILWQGYNETQPLEPDLQQAQQLIKGADHLVWVYPTWWATVPAILKGFIDRVLLPGFAFAYSQTSPVPAKLLKGKTARIIVTSDAPGMYLSLVLKSPGNNMMKKGVLEFSGIKPVKITSFHGVRNAKEDKIKRWVQKVADLGARQI